MNSQNEGLHKEREFLYEVGTSLNSALFIMDRLIEEIKEEEGRQDADIETEKLFLHLATYLEKINKLIKTRSSYMAEQIDEEIRMEKTKRSLAIPTYRKKTLKEKRR